MAQFGFEAKLLRQPANAGRRGWPGTVADESPKEIIEVQDVDESPKANDADELQKETNVAVLQDADADADESQKKIEVEDDLPMLNSPKPTNNDDALCDETSSTPVDRVSEGDERAIELTHILLPTQQTQSFANVFNYD
ncbi:hypothetical protein THAOC_34906 [Thalassiosira oceanica]|uniref:Uncharacterized protein n=1 Tax=Thalassiosira oceanica TaxID=159749 RepID=K0R473_THAOC|nr:hypothetical protein THAOC_34906 [Thalassiosira oceanica]|eukprot:EJK46424.1 hypothetical protein THAOC_34906 [Thalassiosira oceanica]